MPPGRPGAFWATSGLISLEIDLAMDKLLTAEEVADLLNVTPSCVRKWVSLQFIPTVRLGRLVRFDRLAVERWVKHRSEPGRLQRKIEVEI